MEEPKTINDYLQKDHEGTYLWEAKKWDMTKPWVYKSFSLLALYDYFERNGKFFVCSDGTPYAGFVIAGDIFTPFVDKPNTLRIYIYDNHEMVLAKLRNYLILHYDYTLTNKASIFTQGNQKIKILHCKYTSIVRILYSFDIGPSQVAFDGQTYYLTVMAKLAFDTGVMIADIKRKEPKNYAKQLETYMQKGFKLILPFCNHRNYSPKTALGTNIYRSRYFYLDGSIFQPLPITVTKPPKETPARTNLKFFAKLGIKYNFVNGQFTNDDRQSIIEEARDYFAPPVPVNKELLMLKEQYMRRCESEIAQAMNDFSPQVTWFPPKIVPFALPSEWYGDYYYPKWSVSNARYRPDIPYDRFGRQTLTKADFLTIKEVVLANPSLYKETTKKKIADHRTIYSISQEEITIICEQLDTHFVDQPTALVFIEHNHFKIDLVEKNNAPITTNPAVCDCNFGLN